MSLAKRSKHGRSYARRLFMEVAGDGNEQSRWPMQKLFELSDLEIGALVWHIQIAEFHRVLPLLEQDRLASLDCDTFLASPEETLEALDQFFGYGLGRAHIHEVAEGPLMKRDSKRSNKLFSAAQRLEQSHEIGRQIGAVLDEIVAWSYKVCPGTLRGTPLPNGLIPARKPDAASLQ